MNRTEFKRIIEQYEGVIKETEECIEITHSIGRESFTIGIKYNDSLYGDKRLNKSIYAGFGTPKATEQDVVRELENYHFQKKQQTQMSIFDL